ncbi:hypothetical protein BHE74_00018584, partial [Ensete ventricosum]
VVLRTDGDRLYPWPSVFALGRQPQWVSDATSCGHLVCKPAHGHYARKRPPLRVGTIL